MIVPWAREVSSEFFMIAVENRRIQFKEDKVKQNKRDFQQNNERFESRDSTRHSNRDIEIERFK